MYFQPEVIYRNEDADRKNSIIRYIGNRVLTKNTNFLCALVGMPGVGKSWSGLALCEAYSKMHGVPFDPKIHVISSLKQLLELIVNKDLQKNIQIGTPLLFEEPQVEHRAEDWQNEINQMLATLLSTFRNQRLVIFFTLPYMNMITKKSRILFNAEFRVMGFDKSTGVSTIKPRFLEYNQDLDRFYRKRLIIYYKVRGKIKMAKKKLNKWKLEKASEDVLRIYEEFKSSFTKNLNENMLNELKEKEKKEDKENKSRDFLRVAELYREFGENYVKILSELPHLTPYVAENYLKLAKKSYN